MRVSIVKMVELWWRDERGLAAVEAAMVFPILLTLFLGLFDLGNGILANQKTIRASQVTADLLARNEIVDSGEINEAIEAGRLAYEPMSSNDFGIDIISVCFDDEAAGDIVWRETRDMSAIDDVLGDVSSLAEAGNGVLVVAVEYTFEPLFAGFIVNDIPMRETAFVRGRKSAIVCQDGVDCTCGS